MRPGQPVYLPGGPRGYSSAPEPDLSVVAGPIHDYLERHPGPDDMALVVEFAASYLAEQRGTLARYAWSGIPSIWIVNLVDDVVEVYTSPSGPVAAPGYKKCEVKRPGDSLAFTVSGDDAPARPIGPIDVEVLIP